MTSSNIENDLENDDLGFEKLKIDLDFNHNCKYYETEEFCSSLENKEEYFSVLSLNIRSLTNKVDQLQELLHDVSTDKFQFSVVCLQETWNIVDTNGISLDGYNFEAVLRGNKQGGGVGIAVLSSLKYETIQDYSKIVSGQYESLFLKIFVGPNKYKIVACIYRIPGGNLKQFNDWINDLLSSFSSEKEFKNADEIILCGDFNINLLNYEDHTQTNDFLNSLIASSFLPAISLPSRITEKSASLIDNIFSNKLRGVQEGGLLFSSISDHLPVFSLNICQEKVKEKREESFRNLSRKNVNIFKNKLSQEDWSPIITDSNPESAFEKFSGIIQDNFDSSFPMQIKKPNKRLIPNKPWMTPEILSIRKKKQKLLNEKIRFRTKEAKAKFDSCNNQYKHKIRREKKKYYERKFSEVSTDMKKTWSFLNSLIKKNKSKHSVPSVFKDDMRSYENFSEISEGFNDFFCNVGPQLASSIPNVTRSYSDYLGEPVNNEFHFKYISENAIYTSLRNLKSKSSVGKDGISMKMLKEIMPSIIEPVKHLFNLSLRTGFIPESYKCAKIIPIHKASEKDRFDNYRPISILPAFSKLLEKLVCYQVVNFLEKNNIFYEHQYGFRKNRDTTQPLVHLINKIYEGLNKPTSEYTLSIFVDLRKAFDTCDFSILLNKLKHYGFRGLSLKWFENYITGRTQYVNVNGENSKEKNITVGVPQGSVIGPILFLIYINDLPKATQFFASLFADDTLFAVTGSDPKRLIEFANEELEKCSTWFKANKLSLNVSKTKFMIFRSNSLPSVSKDFKLFINQFEIERIGTNCKTKSFKFVGVSLDETLTWDQHINNVNNKLSSANFALNQVKHFLPQKILKSLYDTMFKPHIDYSNIIWGISKSKGINNIQKNQKKAIRNIVGAKYNSHTDPIFGKLETLKFEDLVNLNICKFSAKFIHENLPSTFSTVFKKLNSTRTYKMLIDIPKSKSLELFPAVYYPKIWNQQSIKLRSSKSVTIVKNLFKSTSVTNYKRFRCNKNKCFPCKK